MGVGEAHERERLARRHGVAALAAEEHDVPAALEQSLLELVAAAGAPDVQSPAVLLQRGQDRLGVCVLNVGE